MNYDLAFKKKKNSFVEIFTNAQFTYSKLNGESSMETYTTICKIDSQWEFAVWLRKLQLVPCHNLEGWDGMEDGWEVQGGGVYVYLWLSHANVWKKPTQYCKGIILQLKINKF